MDLNIFLFVEAISVVPRIAQKMSAMDYTIFNELRLEGKLCDVVIEVNSFEFRAHKAILCACSSYFCNLFNSTEKQRYQITGLSPDIMRLIIEYVYSRSVPVTEDNVESLLQAANHFCIMGLAQACCDFLAAHLCPENCIGTWQAADVYFCPPLRRHAYRYILHNFEEVGRGSEEFLRLSLPELGGIIQEDELNARQEDVVFESILRWIAHMPEERQPFLSLLLPKVRMALMNADYFMDQVKNNPVVRSRDECKPIILEAMKALCEYNINRSSNPDYRNPLTRPRLPYAVLLAIGGWSGSVPTNAIESYDARAGCWVNVTQEQESPRAYHGTVYLDGFVYCLGGYNSMEYFSSVRKFNPATLTWHEVAPMHFRRCYVSVAVLDGYIYAMGGLDGHVRLNTAERYKPETNQWSLISHMHEQRSDASATSLRGKVYICGGFNGQDCLFTAEYYNPQVNQWTEITPMSSRRSGLGVVTYGEEVYVVGGFDGVTRLRTADAYDPATNTWRAVPDMITARSNFGIEVLDGRLFVVGGFNGTTTTDYVECYDEKTNEWSVVHCMAFFRSALSCCVVPDLCNIARYTAPRTFAEPAAEEAGPPDGSAPTLR
ncbi:kelch-like protein 10 [Megalops cyprinoides]|uniref:kelch-like protein 10 n=1 Tax=Megalops cyprinoides TaxID=118141 RepID=UPI001864A233|nr:kelch-like protein 10 [Megalops cyprinoides]